MKVLIVFAHPEPRSFNGALKDRAIAALQRQGHEVQISDLYRLQWKSALDGNDFPGPRRDEDYLDLSVEQEHAFQGAGLTPDIELEQQKVLWCDLLIFQFPIWWFGMPAILKGWVDRVMSRGFSYATGRKYDSGLFRGRRAMICATTGTAASLYEADGVDGHIMHILWPVHNGIFHYLGFEVLPPYIAWMPGNVTLEEREGYLAGYAAHLQAVDSLVPLYFHPRQDYGPDQRLKPGVVARSGFQWNAGAGQDHDDAG